MDFQRSCYCGEPRETDEGKELTLTGWVHSRRDHGGVIFVDLRDREGFVQLVFNPELNPAALEAAHDVRNEYVLVARGKLRLRSEETVNPNMPTGKVELMVEEVEVLNTSKPSPFAIEDDAQITENVRLKHRFLDLRRPYMQNAMRTRHDVCRISRDYLNDNGFIEVETPMLTRSTPEGARDYLVPSRVSQGSFFALPQSPQLFKQLLMVGGMDRYYQIARCFRDEDLRADRQPEFTQIDLEMSFVTGAQVMALVEELVKGIFSQVLGREFEGDFPRMPYDEAVARYGTDRPDTRFAMELVELTDVFHDSGFKVFRSACDGGGAIKAICVKGGATMSRKEIDDLGSYAADFGAKGMAWIKMTDGQWQSPIVKFFKDDEREAVSARTGVEDGDLVLFAADSKKVVHDVLGALRIRVAEQRGLIDEKRLDFLWVTDFPLVEWKEEDKRYYALHHPFTAPLPEDMDKLASDPGAVKADAYDIVLNGTELGGGSLRIHRPDVQSRVLEVLGIDDEEARDKFGFLLDALAYGAPPHGGLALGLDRLVATLIGADSIRDAIAFPKTQKASCLLTEAPSPVDPLQLRGLGLKVTL
ncbi:MAG: aspartyl-tRNA synthetase [Hyphomicrobiaceae bacterium]